MITLIILLFVLILGLVVFGYISTQLALILAAGVVVAGLLVRLFGKG